ncbi:unnamed protein product [Rhizoctonia solani]|uniref:Uncharacterized protein n=1 Tax=Rhizoctonia solani TaxID=456999 RepID=A0A8H3DTJ2_9AGAM
MARRQPAVAQGAIPVVLPAIAHHLGVLGVVGPAPALDVLAVLVQMPIPPAAVLPVPPLMGSLFGLPGVQQGDNNL